MIKRFLPIYILLSSLAFSAVEYEDLPKDHWAYDSVKFLVEEGVLEQDSYSFRGDSNLKRYDFAYSLGKLLNKVQLEKANKNDLLVLEKLVSEFAVELSKIGFDTDTFNAKIENLNETVQLMKTTIDKQQKIIDDLLKRVEKLEKDS
jgi:hypothetical protein